MAELPLIVQSVSVAVPFAYRPPPLVALPPAIVSPEIVAVTPELTWNTPLASLAVTVSNPAPGPTIVTVIPLLSVSSPWLIVIV